MTDHDKTPALAGGKLLDLAAITARADAATAGPWAIYLDPMEDGVVYSVSSGPATEGYNLNGGDFDTAEGMTETDAEFIARARADVPALVAEVRALREEREEAREEATWATLAADTQRERAGQMQAAIDAAPHGERCPMALAHRGEWRFFWGSPQCECWKAGL